MPSLLMQAAKSAAIADGLVPKARTSPVAAANNDTNSSSQSGASSNSRPASINGANGDAVAAALAMVAAGNAKPSPQKFNGSTNRVGNGNGSGNGNGNGTSSYLSASVEASDTPVNTPSSVASQPKDQQSYGASGQQSSANNPSTAGSAAHRLASQQQSVTPKQSSTPVTSSQVNRPVSAPKSNSASSSTGGGGVNVGSSGVSSKKKGPPLRRGKWTPEEEAYASRLIMEFKAGLLPLTDGTTLRTFLSKLLNCDPMRISKKFVGSNCIGKQVFRRRTADINRLTPEQIQQSRAQLSE